MITMNDNMSTMLLSDGLLPIIGAAESPLLVLFDGTPPTKADYETNKYSSWSGSIARNGNIVYSKVLAWHKARTSGAGQELATFDLAGLVEFSDSAKFEYKFARQNIEADVKNAGTATWFAIFNGTSHSTTIDSYFTVFGTVGGVGSGADLELLDTAISPDVIYKANDIFIEVA